MVLFQCYERTVFKSMNALPNALRVGETESDPDNTISNQTYQVRAHRLICKMVDNLVNRLCAFWANLEEKRIFDMKRKSVFSIAMSLLLAATLTVAVSAFQVDSFTKPIDDTSMNGYLYRSSSSSYVFSAETTIDSNPTRDASLYVSVTVVPYTASSETQFEEDHTDHSHYVAVTSPSASTTNAKSASGNHSATIWDGTQSSSNYGKTSWSKSGNN